MNKKWFGFLALGVVVVALAGCAKMENSVASQKTRSELSGGAATGRGKGAT